MHDCKSQCSNGRHYITEAEHVDMLRATEGTGETTTVSFGFGGAGRVWIDCPWCREHEPARREAIVRTIGVWLNVKSNVPKPERTASEAVAPYFDGIKIANDIAIRTANSHVFAPRTT